MTYKSLFKLAIQLLGLFFIFTAIIEIPKAVVFNLLISKQSGFVLESAFSQFISIAIIAILGYVLIKIASKISDMFVPTDDAALLDIKKENVIEIIIITIGIFMIVTRIPGIYPALVSLSTGGDLSVSINTAVTIIACLILVLKAKVISNFLVKIS